MARGRIPDSDIAAIRERTPIEEVVGEYVQLTPGGVDSLKGLSPFKDEKTPSFHVRPNKGYFHCFATGEGGDVFSFLMKMEHVTFPEA
ncbi:MAG: CHC2 zinc finger domain-containing protein, partial [Corynebacterium nuruki]|nr:CHC2 zinc finger domain-containing protein [Corynebacterium nuruki]